MLCGRFYSNAWFLQGFGPGCAVAPPTAHPPARCRHAPELRLRVFASGPGDHHDSRAATSFPAHHQSPARLAIDDAPTSSHTRIAFAALVPAPIAAATSLDDAPRVHTHAYLGGNICMPLASASAAHSPTFLDRRRDRRAVDEIFPSELQLSS